MNRQYGALSGVAILLIVVNHAIHFGLQVSPVDGGWLGFLIVLQALGGFAVPVFLFVSGAFLCYAAGELSFTFMRNSLERILWPYVIWSGLFYLLTVAAGGAQDPASGYLKNLLVGYPYHFVPLLIFWYLTAPLLVRLGRRHGVLLLTAIAACQVLLLALRYPAAFPPLPGWTSALKPPVLFTSMSDWAIYFPFGLVFGLHDARLRPTLFRLRRLSAAAVAAVFGLGLLNAFGVVWAPWARFVAPVPLMFLLPVVDRASIPFLDRFERLGKRSYGIYLAHFVVINLAVIAVTRSNTGVGRLPLVVFPVFLVLALGLSMLLMDVLARPLPARRFYRYVFGIVPPAVALRRRLA